MDVPISIHEIEGKDKTKYHKENSNGTTSPEKQKVYSFLLRSELDVQVLSQY